MSGPRIDTRIDTIWFTRCPVPTATGLAYKLGWLEQEFAPDGIAIKTLQDAGPALARHHYDHRLPTLIREGGNLLALPAKAQGAPTRLIGLTWIDEWQSILVRPDTPLARPEQLEGLRLALPPFRPEDLERNQRGRSIARGMSLAGYRNALAAAGLGFDDVELVELAEQQKEQSGTGAGAADLGTGLWRGIDALVRGDVDAVYVKGAAAAEAARAAGLVVGIDFDDLAPRFRVNNGTPRPLTVHQDFIDHHFDLLVRFLAQTLRAAEWAKANLDGVRRVLQDETRASEAGVAEAYRKDFHLALAPDLSAERLELFRRQKNFQLAHGFLDRDVDIDAWVDRRPLEEALRWLEQRAAA